MRDWLVGGETTRVHKGWRQECKGQHVAPAAAAAPPATRLKHSTARTCANIIWPGLMGIMGLPDITRKGAPAAAAPPADRGRPRTGVEGSEPSAPEAAAICNAVGLKGRGWQKPPQVMPPPGVPGCEVPCSMLVSEPPLEAPGLPANMAV